jgi:LmbE family N-acetylglucosaminyl deacetylase
MAYYASSNIQQWQVAQIRRFKPLVILGHDLNGEYGNGGHKVNAHFLIQAVHMAKDPSQFSATAEKYGTWETPKLYLHLYEENAWVFDVDTPITRDPLFRSPREIAEQAVQAHVSQQKGIRYLRNLPGSEKYMDCNRFGLYHSLVGPDTKADVMEHIHVAYWRSKTQATKHLSIVSPQ